MPRAFPLDELLHGVAEAMARAIDTGVEPIQAATAVAILIADYSRAAYGDGVVDQLAMTMQKRRGMPLNDNPDRN